MKFQWDPLKEIINIEKHGFSFSEAGYVFADPNSLSMFDEEHSDEEDRWITLGMLPGGAIVVVMHTFRSRGSEEYVRIISVRRATKSETRQYQKRLL